MRGDTWHRRSERWSRLREVVIFGAGEFASLVRFHLTTEGEHSVVAFTVDRDYVDREGFEGLPLVAFERLDEMFPPDRVEVFVALGYRKVNRPRADAYARVAQRGYRCLTFVSPHAIVAANVELGENCFVFESAVLQPGVRLGSDTIVRTGAVVGHDCQIGDHCFIAPRASISGNVVIGEFAFVGNNATIRDGVTIAPHTVVGAGSLIKADTRAGEVYAQPATSPLPGLHSSDLDDL